MNKVKKAGMGGAIAAIVALVLAMGFGSQISFNQTKSIVTAAQSQNDAWPNVSYYCGAPIDFALKDDNDVETYAIDPASIGYEPLDEDGLIFKAAKNAQGEHVTPAQFMLGHLDDWKTYGRTKAATHNAFIKEVLAYSQNVRWAIGRINLLRSNKMFGENLQNAHTFGDCGIKIQRFSGGLFEPSDDKKGNVARIVLGTYMHFSGGREVDGHQQYLRPLPADQVALLNKWNKQDPLDAQEIRESNLIGRYWEQKELSIAKRRAKKACKTAEQEKICRIKVFERLKEAIADLSFTNPMVDFEKSKLPSG